jgi:predicted RNA methylase
MPILFWLGLIFFTFAAAYMYYISLSSQAGPVYKPTKNKDVEKMLDFAEVDKTDVVIDPGSGDGRIMVAAAQRGAQAIGYEIDPFLVHQSRKRIKKLGLQGKAEVKMKSFWQADFNQATVIATYLFPKYMVKLKEVLEENLDHPVKLVSNDYQIPNMDYLDKKENIYLYEIMPR